jgi:RNAse (barnase) inhibitor barstar
MRIIELDATGWKTVHDFYNALLPEIGAPRGHGRNVNALIDSVIWGGINAIEPPFIVRVYSLSACSKEVVEEIELAKQGLAEGRADFRVRNGGDVDVELQTVP